MLSEQRYEEILNVLDREGSVKATVLCGLLGTSRETIRRDLETMEAKGMLRRIHGGACLLYTSGMFKFLCMDTLTDRVPTPKKSPFWYALWVYTNKRLFYMGN